MTQQTVYNTIKKAKKPITAKEIAEKLKICPSTVNTSLFKLRKYNEVKYTSKPIRIKKKDGGTMLACSYRYWV